MVDYRSQLVLGERGVVLCLARTQEQSQVVLEYVAGIIEAAPILAKTVIRRAAASLTLFNRGATIVIAVRAASFRSVRGLTCVAAVADEIAFWQAEDGSANPDVEILRAVRPTLLTTHGPLIAISSPYARRGELWTTFKRDNGPQGDPLILVAHAASRDMNPTLRQADIDREMARDAASGLAEYYRRVSDRHFGLCQPGSHRRLRCTWRLRVVAGCRRFVSRIRRSIGRGQRCDDTGDRPSSGRRGHSRRCRDRNMFSPPSGRRTPTSLWCTALRPAGRKSFSSPTSTPSSLRRSRLRSATALYVDFGGPVCANSDHPGGAAKGSIRSYIEG